MLRSLLNWAARKVKGPSYRVDPDLPLASLVSFAARRGMSLLRGFIVFLTGPGRFSPVIFVESGVILRNRWCTRVGRGVTLGRGVLIDGLSREGVRIGSRVSIGPYSIVEATGVVSNLGLGFEIGDDSGMGAFSFVGAAGGVRIGSNVIMGQRVSFHSENHVADDLSTPIRLQGVTRVGITIEDDCWVGANVVFLDGTYVERGCIVAAGAVVRGRIPAYSVIGGVPARVLKKRGQPSER